MKNILFIMPKLESGGAERVLVNIINHLDRDIFNISLLLFSSSSLIDTIRDDIEIYTLNIKSTLKGLPLLLKKIYILKPDIIFSGIGNLNLYLSIFIPIVKLFLPKTIFIARQASILTLNNSRERSPKLYEWLYKRVYKNYDRVICQSLYMQKDLIENYSFPKDKSVVINNPIDIESLENLSKDKIDYPFSSDYVRLIHIGQLRYEKRQDLLLKAFSKLDSRYSLTIIGDGAERENLESLASKLNISNRVTFLGHKKNPYSYLKEADIFLLTSEYEGFPNVLLEANLFGLIVVSFNSIGGVSEIIQNRKNGILVSQGDIDAFATTIENIDIKSFNRGKIIEDTKGKYNIDLIIKRYQKNIIKDKL